MVPHTTITIDGKPRRWQFDGNALIAISSVLPDWYERVLKLNETRKDDFELYSALLWAGFASEEGHPPIKQFRSKITPLQLNKTMVDIFPILSQSLADPTQAPAEKAEPQAPELIEAT